MIAPKIAPKIERLFTEHPASVDETYGEHLIAASSFSLAMFIAALACLVHAVLPFMFVRTGSEAIESLYDRMVANRRRFEEGRLAKRAA
jgi:hypothetical protein